MEINIKIYIYCFGLYNSEYVTTNKNILLL